LIYAVLGSVIVVLGGILVSLSREAIRRHDRQAGALEEPVQDAAGSRGGPPP
jgi:hypothetical protein